MFRRTMRFPALGIGIKIALEPWQLHGTGITPQSFKILLETGDALLAETGIALRKE